MRKFITIITLFIIITILSSCKEEKKQTYALTTFAINNIDIIGTDKILRNAEIKGRIKEGETIRTGIDSTAILQIKDVGVIRIQPYSEVTFNAIKKDYTTVITLKEGKLYSNVLTGSGRYIIKTETITVRTMGTKFLVIHNENETTVPVQEGSVMVFHKGKKRKGIKVKERNIAKIDSSRKINIIPMSGLREIKLQKLGLQPYIENAEEMSQEQIGRLLSNIWAVERRADMITGDVVEILREDILQRDAAIQEEREQILKEEIAMQLKIAINEERLIREQKDFYSKRDAAKKKQKMLINNVSQLEKKLKKKEKESKTVKAGLEKDVNSLNDQIAALEKDFNAEKEKLTSEKMAENEKLRKELNARLAEKEKLQANLDKDREKLRLELSAKISEKDKLQTDLEAERKRLQDELNTKIAEKEKLQIALKNERMRLKKELNAKIAEKEKEKLEKELRAKIAEEERLKASLDTEKAELRKKLNAEIVEKERLKKVLNAEKEKLKGDLVAELENLKKEKAQLQKEKEAIQKQEEERKKQLASLDTESKDKLESLEKNYVSRIKLLEKQLQEKEQERIKTEDEKNRELARVKEEHWKKKQELEEEKKRQEKMKSYAPLVKLKKKGKKVFSFRLKDGSVIKGAVESRTERFLKLDVGDGIINIPIQEIVSRKAE